MTGVPEFTAVVLAGSRGPEDPVAVARGVTYKAFAAVSGKPMILRVIDTLLDSPWIGRILICVDGDAMAAALPETPPLITAKKIEIVTPAQSPAASILEAVAKGGGKPPYLVVTADHALLTIDMLDKFCQHAADALAREDTDVTVALVPATAYMKAYPHSKRTFIRFRDDGYSGCNLFGLLTDNSLAAPLFWRQLEKDRKKPWRMAMALGPGNLLRFLLRTDTADQAIARIGRTIGIKAGLLKMPIVEAAIDVDKIQDLELVEKILGTRETV